MNYFLQHKSITFVDHLSRRVVDDMLLNDGACFDFISDDIICGRILIYVFVCVCVCLQLYFASVRLVWVELIYEYI